MKRRAPLIRRTRLAPISARRRKQTAALRAWRELVLGRAGYRCQRCGDRATDAHHTFRRATHPDLVTDPRNGAALCRSCHEWVHAFPADARAAGFLHGIEDRP